MDLMNLFSQQLNGDVLKKLSQNSGINNEEKTSEAAQNVFSTILAAVNQNASTEKGAESLNKALEKDHDGSVMDNVMNLFGGTQKTSATNGAGILKHVLGDKEETVVNGLSEVNKTSPEATSALMQSIAPMVMGMLAKAKLQEGLNVANLSQFLGQQNSASDTSKNQLSGIMSMLDKNGDGNVMDDISGLLGGFFGKK